MDARERQIYQLALESRDYREFLSSYFLVTARQGKPNYSALARKAGFSSRGFIPEILDGRRRLTGNSFPKMLELLGTSVVLRNVLTVLVQIEEAELNPEQLSTAELKGRLESLRAKIRTKISAGETDGEYVAALFKSHQILIVFTAISEKEPGSTIPEIARRSSVHPLICEKILEHLMSKGVIRERKGRYIAANSYLMFEGLGEDHSFKASYLETLSELKKHAFERFNASDKLFCQSFFTVDRKKMPDLKKRLREVVQEFSESHTNDDGDAVARMIVGLFS